MSFNKRVLSAGAAPFKASENFKVITYTGTGSSHSVTGVGFKPDIIWTKARSASNSHAIYDSSRGVNKELNPNSADEQGSLSDGISSFDSDGFTVGSRANSNESGVTYVAYCWKVGGGSVANNTDGNATSSNQVNLDAGVSIMKLDSHTGSYTIGHGLEAEPHFVLTKVYSGTTGNWHVYHTTNDSGKWLVLNSNADVQTASAGYEYHTVNSSLVGNLISNSSLSYIHYAWKNIEGFSKFGSYVGDRPNDVFVETGFEPAMVMIKMNGTDNWNITDNRRNGSPAGPTVGSNANSTAVEFDYTNCIQFLSNGFRLIGIGNSGETNNDGSTFIYMAWATDPDEEAPALTDSFNAKAYTGDGVSRPITGFGFLPNLVIIKSRSYARNWYWYDYIRGVNNQLLTNSTQAQAANANRLTAFLSDGFTAGTSGEVNTSSETYISYGWQADDNEPTINDNGSIDSIVSANANAGFSIVRFNKTTNGSTASTFGHGLSSAPEMIWLKRTNGTEDWYMYHTGLGNAARVQLNSTAAQTTGSNVWGQTDPTATVFTVESFNAGEAIAYCFHSISGYSKFGSYEGHGNTQTNTVSFGFAPDFVIVKKKTGTGAWRVFDSIRDGTDGEVTTSRPLRINHKLQIEEATVEYDGSSDPEGYMDFTNDGIEFSTSEVNGDLNEDGETYVYMAWKVNASAADAAGKMAFLVIAGGGSGAGGYGDGAGGIGGAGGGAGGLRTSYGSTSGGGCSNEGDIHLTAGTYTITIGAGGAAAGTTGFYAVGNHGNDSSLAGPSLTTITSLKGGRGGSRLSNAGGGGNGTYGSGGANATDYGGSANAGTSCQGYASGAPAGSGTTRSSSGGGGAAGTGGQATSSAGGAGGNGLAVSITGSSVTYAGGGGGGATDGDTAGSSNMASGSTGGAASGGTGVAGTANTGAGGGGGGAGGSAGDSGAGGSGVVILRLLTSEYSGTVTGSPTVTTSGSSTIIKFTASGTYVHS